MRPEERLHRAIWNALDEIVQEKLATPENEWVLINNNSTERELAIRALTKCGAIRIVKPRMRPYYMLRALQEMQGVEEEPIGYYIATVEPLYTQVVDFYFASVGKKGDTLGDDAVAQITTQLKAWQGSKPAQTPPADPALPANKTEEKKIEKLTVVEKAKNAFKLTIFVNDNYQNPLYFDPSKPTGSFLLRLANEERPLLLSEHKQPFDYLNSAGSQLVTKTGCVQTKILDSDAGYIEPTITVEKIAEKALKQRRGKTPKVA
jgi:hypothetical protein